jgi:hypothetical protein
MTATVNALVITGLWIIPLHPDDKSPIGNEWGLVRKGIKEIDRLLSQYEGAGLGICLGPNRGPGGRWLIDLEIDGPEGMDSLVRLLGGKVTRTMAWSSRRGNHHLFVADDVDAKRLLELLSVCKAVEGKGPGKIGAYHLDSLPGLEIRCGGYKKDGVVKQVQSVIPPTTTDGVARKWIAGPYVIAPLPDAAYACLETIAERLAKQFADEPQESNGKVDPVWPDVGACSSTGTTPQHAWFRKALDDETAAVAATPEGNRRNRLRDAAYNLGGQLHHGYLSESEVAQVLTEAGEKAGLPPDEVRTTVADGLADGKASPLPWPNTLDRPNGQNQAHSGHSGHSGHQWGKIKLGRIPDPVPFPVDAFPDPVKKFCECVASSVGCPNDLPGGAILGVASAAIGRSVSVLLKPGYFGTSSLWLCMIGPPSDGKSPVLEIVGRPIREIDDQLYQAHQAKMQQWEVDRDAAKKAKTPAPKRPVRKRLDVDDITIESLQRILCENPRGVGWLCDELTTCVLGMNQYKPGGKGNDRPTLCKMWSGKPTKRDRAGGEHSRTPFSHVSLVGGIVPDLLSEMKDRQGRADGFLERYLMHFPEVFPIATWNETGIDDQLANNWKGIVERLYKRKMTSKDGRRVPNVVYFDKDAKDEFIRLYNLHVTEMNAVAFPPSLRGPWGKFRELAARLALVLACLRTASYGRSQDQLLFPSIKLIDILGCWKLIDYYKQNFLRVKATIEGSIEGGEDTGLIIRWLRAGKHTEFTERDLYKEVGRFRHDQDSMASALEWLKRKNMIRPAQTTKSGPGRHPSPRWEVHPELFSSVQNVQNVQKGQP